MDAAVAWRRSVEILTRARRGYEMVAGLARSAPSCDTVRRLVGELHRTGAGDRQECGQRWIGRCGLTPAEYEAAFGRGAGEWVKRNLGRQVLRLGGRHERGAEAGADEANTVGARPDFLGDAWRDAGGGERGQDAI